MGLFLDNIEDFRQSFLLELSMFLILIVLIFCFSKDDFFDFLLIIEDGYKNVSFEISKG